MARRVRRRRITIRIQGDSASVRLSDFLEQLEAIRIAFQHTNRVTRPDAKERPTLTYNVVDLRHQSPFAVVLEEEVSGSNGAVSGADGLIAQTLVRHLAAIQSPRGKMPPVRDVDALESYRSVGTALL